VVLSHLNRPINTAVAQCGWRVAQLFAGPGKQRKITQTETAVVFREAPLGQARWQLCVERIDMRSTQS
jgi:hypothetical protein